jgi:hypothetical protein
MYYDDLMRSCLSIINIELYIKDKNRRNMYCSFILLFLMLSNTDCLQPSWGLCQMLHMTIEKKAKIIYSFHKLVFDREDNRLKCFNRATQNYGLWQSVIVINRTRGKQFWSFFSLTRRDTKPEHVTVRFKTDFIVK